MSIDKIFYNMPAANWNEALPLGNGALGAVMYGNPDMEIIHLNLDTLWSGEPGYENMDNKKQVVEKIREHVFFGEYDKAQKLAQDENKFSPSQTYLPLGDLHINAITWDGAPVCYKRSLDMQKAFHECMYQREITVPYNIEHYMRSFISNPDDVMVIKVGNTFGEITSFTMYYDCVLRNDVKTDDNTIYITGTAPQNVTQDSGEVLYYDDDSNSVGFHVQISVVNKGGTLVSENNRLTVYNAEEALIILSAETNFIDYKTAPDKRKNLEESCRKKIKRAFEIGYDKLFENHVNYFSEKYNRVSFSIAEDQEYFDAKELIEDFKKNKNSLIPIEILFNYGRYLMISGSAPGTQAMNLQGIWNKDLLPQWSCNYTTNINTEMNYWMCEKCNLPEFHMPLFDMVEELCEAGEKTAKEVYGCRGSVAHHNVDLWRKSTPGPGNPCNSLWNMSIAWFTTHFWEHYLYTFDKEFLEKRAFPVMKKCVEFYSDFLMKKDGYYSICPSTSPENRFVYNEELCAITRDNAMDIGILSDLLENYIKAAKILGVVNENTSKALDILKNLPSYKIMSDGRLMEWEKDHKEFQPGHRHFSHLYGLYPGNSLKKARKEYVNAAEKSLEVRLENGSGYTGWSCAWVINLYAALGRGEKAYEYIKKLICDSMYMNFMDAHPPFQIDGNFGFTSGVCEMLMQSEIDENENVIINILPAVPKQWKQGSIKGIKAKGNVVLDISWENNKAIVFVKAENQKYILKCNNFVLEEVKY